MSNYTVVTIFRDGTGTGRTGQAKLESDVLVADMLCVVIEAVTEDARDSCLFSP